MMSNPTVQFEIESDMRHLGGLCASLREFMADYGVVQPSDAEIVFRELIASAIAHGNGANLERLVFVRVEVAEDSIVITVRDQGAGFEHQKCAGISSGNHHNRGLALTYMLTARLEYNNPGNEVIAWVSREKFKEGANGR